jgi:hypothetical protein
LYGLANALQKSSSISLLRFSPAKLKFGCTRSVDVSLESQGRMKEFLPALDDVIMNELLLWLLLLVGMRDVLEVLLRSPDEVFLGPLSSWTAAMQT